MEFLMDPSIWAGLLALIVLEIVLGIDNLVFIAILADKLPPHQRDKARIIGLSLALLMRLGLLSVISWMITLTQPLFTLGDMSVSGRDLILFLGGLFLVYKATVELHEKMEGKGHSENQSRLYAGFWVVVTQIVVLDAVFSLDAVITAVGMVDNIYVMMTAVVIAMCVMLLASKPLTIFVNKHPTVVILCLSFLLMIGFSLIAESFGLHIPKGYLYAAIGFSILIEVFNQLSKHNSQRNQEKLPFRERTADAIIKLISRNPQTISPSNEEPQPEKIFADEERYMISGVLTLSERSVKGIMTPRNDISWLNINDSPEKLREAVLSVPHSFFPVARDNIDNVFAMVRAKEFLDALDSETDLKPLMSKYRPVYISDHMNTLQVMKILRQSNGSPALVVDEFGSIKGLITPLDIFEAIAGEFPDVDETLEIQKMEDGTWLVDGAADLYQLELELNVNHLISRKDGSFISVAGLILEELGHIPEIGEQIVRANLMFTVKEIHENRIHLVEVRILDDESLPIE